MSNWNPELYLKFGKERTQPSIDLLARISHLAPGSIIDVGCGPGNSTAVLRTRWPEAKILGLDNSQSMIDAAHKAYPEGDWLVADIENYASSKSFDLVFSNATLQWINFHEILIPHLLNLLAPKGLLAVQVPANGMSPLIKTLHEISTKPAWKQFAPPSDQTPNYRTPQYYYELLSSLDVDFEVWQTTYFHKQASIKGIIEWSRATSLRPWLDKLPDDQSRNEFEAELLSGITPLYSSLPDGSVIFPFPRTFFTAKRKQ